MMRSQRYDRVSGILLALCLLLGLSVALLWRMAQMNGLGDAKSPQTAEMMEGTRAWAAGGRARLWYAYHDELGPHVDVECGADRLQLYFLPLGERVETECGITLTHLDTERVGGGARRSRFRIEWDDADAVAAR